MAKAALTEVISIAISLPVGGAAAGYVLARLWLLDPHILTLITGGIGMAGGLSFGAILLFLAMDSRHQAERNATNSTEEAF